MAETSHTSHTASIIMPRTPCKQHADFILHHPQMVCQQIWHFRRPEPINGVPTFLA